MSEKLAARVIKRVGESADTRLQVEMAWRLALARVPDKEESAWAIEFVEENDLAAFARILLNSNELIWIE